MTSHTILDQLQGVWFPTTCSVGGVLSRTAEPQFPPPREPWVLTIHGSDFHVTSSGDYYATGGELRVLSGTQFVYVYPELPEEFDSHVTYRLEGDELLVSQDATKWFTASDARYVRVARQPTAEMMELFRGCAAYRHWHPDRGPR